MSWFRFTQELDEIILNPKYENDKFIIERIHKTKQHIQEMLNRMYDAETKLEKENDNV